MNRARDRVRDDAALVGEVASTVSGALGLDSANRTLGRNVVIAALDAHIAAATAVATLDKDTVVDGSSSGGGDGLQLQPGEKAFRVAAKGYGPLGDSMLSNLFAKVTTRLRGALVQQQAMQEEAKEGGGGREGGEDEDGGVAGFRKAERLSGFGVTGALKGGLVKRHTFQVWFRRDLWKLTPPRELRTCF